MKHARADYDRIQDPAGLIPAEEPVFLLRGQDRAAPSALETWAYVAEQLGADPDMVKAAQDQAMHMRVWQITHAAKVPDLPAPAGGVT